MRLLLTLVLFTIVSPCSFAQEKNGDTSTARKTTPGTNSHLNRLLDKESDTITIVEVMPEPAFDLSRFLSDNLQYPKAAMDSGIGGKVIVKFVINEDGRVSGVRAVSSPHPLLSMEAERLVKLMPNWKPGTSNGKPVKVYHTMPLNFHRGDNAFKWRKRRQKEH